ncbi:AAA_domain-containing protein [Hexamita inflata]|uniref:AAA domain-containing protein n=1 Tax=Hexamita inflata TaxID=28002 RepID=A0AA86TSD8_9EUKA|nr:AAA domain-containing protein [Hexamita inflata]
MSVYEDVIEAYFNLDDDHCMKQKIYNFMNPGKEYIPKQIQEQPVYILQQPKGRSKRLGYNALVRTLLSSSKEKKTVELQMFATVFMNQLINDLQTQFLLQSEFVTMIEEEMPIWRLIMNFNLKLEPTSFNRRLLYYLSAVIYTNIMYIEDSARLNTDAYIQSFTNLFTLTLKSHTDTKNWRLECKFMFELFIVLLSQTTAECAKKVLETLNKISTKFNPDFNITKLMLQLRHKYKANEYFQLFTEDIVQYMIQIINARKLYAENTNKMESFTIDEKIYQQTNFTFIHRFYAGYCFTPHTLLQQYNYATYFMTQLQCLKADIITSIIQDLQRDLNTKQTIKIEENLFNCNSIKTNQYSKDIDFIIIFNLQNNELSDFNICQLTAQDNKFQVDKQLKDGQYLYVFVHPSIRAHIQIFQSLIDNFTNEMKNNKFELSLDRCPHKPMNVLINKDFKFERKKIKENFALNFCTNVDPQTINILKRTLQNDSIVYENNKLTINFDVFKQNSINEFIRPLLPSQLSCLIHSQVNDLLLIIGPPGSGKTYTTVQIVRNFLLQLSQPFFEQQPTQIQKQFQETYNIKLIQKIHSLFKNKPAHQIVLVAHSNNAVDQMADSLLHNFPLINPFIFRIGSTQLLNDFTVNGYINQVFDDLVEMELIKPQKDEKPSLFTIFQVMKGNLLLFADILEHFQSVQTLQTALFASASIVVGTTTVIQQIYKHLPLQPIIIVEEAARMAEYNLALVFALQPAKIILIGDVMQLPPLVKDQILENESGMSQSLFFKLIQKVPNVIVLDQQKRVPTQVCDLYRNIYSKYLPLNLRTQIQDFQPRFIEGCLNYIHVNGQFYNETNQQEASEIIQLLQHLKNTKQFNSTEISVLALYKSQAKLIQNQTDVKCYTVDEYQGLENQCIVLSLTTTKPSRFANDLNRHLVAFSRCLQQMWVVGNIYQFNNEIIQNLIEYDNQQQNALKQKQQKRQ